MRPSVKTPFFERADCSGGPDACWPWQGAHKAVPGSEYGKLRRQGKWYLAHRVAWIIVNGPIPVGLGILHHCDNPPCINPRHLYAGTAADNNRDMRARGRGSYGLTVGEASPRAKLTEQQVRQIYASLAAGRPQRVVAAEVGIAESAVWNIGAGRRWRHLGLAPILGSAKRAA